MLRILILGGTGDARALASKLVGELSGRAGLRIILSLAGRTTTPRLPGDGDGAGDGDGGAGGERVTMRCGGFDGASGLARYLRAECIDLVVDATHPFAVQISNNARAACDEAGIGRVLLTRQPWCAEVGDRWTVVASVDEAVRYLEKMPPQHLFLTVGSSKAARFLQLHQHYITMRMIEAPRNLHQARRAHPHNDLILARGPFHLTDEQQLFKERGFDVLVSKNAGGDAVQAKIVAARRLQKPVLLVQAPRCEASGDVVFECVDDVVSYVKRAVSAVR